MRTGKARAQALDFGALAESVEDDVRTLFGECLGDAETDAAGRASDQRSLAFSSCGLRRVNAFMVAQSCPALQFGKIAMIRFSQVSLIRGTKLLLEGGRCRA